MKISSNRKSWQITLTWTVSRQARPFMALSRWPVRPWTCMPTAAVLSSALVPHPLTKCWSNKVCSSHMRRTLTPQYSVTRCSRQSRLILCHVDNQLETIRAARFSQDRSHLKCTPIKTKVSLICWRPCLITTVLRTQSRREPRTRP